jgi:hypothetical protein
VVGVGVGVGGKSVLSRIPCCREAGHSEVSTALAELKADINNFLSMK